MEVVINKCYGGFSLSAKAVAKLAELQNRPVFFFICDYRKNFEYSPVTLDQCTGTYFSAFDIPEA